MLAPEISTFMVIVVSVVSSSPLTQRLGGGPDRRRTAR
ncbi:hypothetical protein ACTIVE_5561 [Actinomadura verrucosospora]|uniref:Uncharacterized protein n=1 Tax=Actinomadura verrucosospora TaxID=46165 RepID=A0A7D3VVU1_ACTVE|nr:hypothetical protein ACTIVE_5561 [Actinomadura verrucosospora]